MGRAKWGVEWSWTIPFRSVPPAKILQGVSKFFQHPVSTQLVPTPDRHQSSTEKVKKKNQYTSHTVGVCGVHFVSQQILICTLFSCAQISFRQKGKSYTLFNSSRENKNSACVVSDISPGGETVFKVQTKQTGMRNKNTKLTVLS